MAQVLHESEWICRFKSKALTTARSACLQVWPSRFKPIGPLDPMVFAHNQEKLGNEVYGGRMGNAGPNDGFTYRGRGLLQLTGKDSYIEATTIICAQAERSGAGFRDGPRCCLQRAMVPCRLPQRSGHPLAATRSPIRMTFDGSRARLTAA